MAVKRVRRKPLKVDGERLTRNEEKWYKLGYQRGLKAGVIFTFFVVVFFAFILFR